MNDRLALVIEDDFDASVIFAKALEVVGFTTEVIASGDKALERLKETEPEMIVLDLHLPEVIGNDILKFIRSEERLSHTIVIVASADPRSAETIQDQADLVLIKPTTFSQVRDFAMRLSRGSSRRKTSPQKSGEEAEKQPEKKPANDTKEAKPSPDHVGVRTDSSSGSVSSPPSGPPTLAQDNP
jgi:DNA-binding response OmpR family regulator